MVRILNLLLLETIFLNTTIFFPLGSTGLSLGNHVHISQLITTMHASIYNGTYSILELVHFILLMELPLHTSICKVVTLNNTFKCIYNEFFTIFAWFHICIHPIEEICIIEPGVLNMLDPCSTEGPNNTPGQVQKELVFMAPRSLIYSTIFSYHNSGNQLL